MVAECTLADHFASFRQGTIGHAQEFKSPFGIRRLIYADWAASGRAYGPIEDCLRQQIMPFLANTHTGSTMTSKLISEGYAKAKQIIKGHVNAGDDDVLLFCGSGMTAAVNKLQRILGLKVPERLKGYLTKGSRIEIDEQLRPVVFITHMEHHSNQISWLETIATVEIIKPGSDGHVDLQNLSSLLKQYRHRKHKIAAVTACSNVTGIETPYHQIAKMVHASGGLCFVDFAGSAPYVAMDMHPAESGTHLDAIYFSPHKFLGGPGTPGILIFNKNIYDNAVPDQPGGGTIVYSNPWSGHDYVNDIEQREDGGTPPILQGIKAAMCVRLKEAMGTGNMRQRKDELLEIIFDRFSNIKNVEVLVGDTTKRLGTVSFTVKGAHYNLIVQLLNDRFGIQTRGGCACAGTYGHYLLRVNEETSRHLRHAIRSGMLSAKPGWVRLSIHPSMTNSEVDLMMGAIAMTASCFALWAKDYCYDPLTNEYKFTSKVFSQRAIVEDWYNTSSWQKKPAL